MCSFGFIHIICVFTFQATKMCHTVSLIPLDSLHMIILYISLCDVKGAALTLGLDFKILACLTVKSKRWCHYIFLFPLQVQNTLVTVERSEKDQLEHPLWLFKPCFVFALQEGLTLWEEIQERYLSCATSSCLKWYGASKTKIENFEPQLPVTQLPHACAPGTSHETGQMFKNCHFVFLVMLLFLQ